jgi:hypothetical protein
VRRERCWIRSWEERGEADAPAASGRRRDSFIFVFVLRNVLVKEMCWLMESMLMALQTKLYNDSNAEILMLN